MKENIEDICRYYNASRNGLKTESKYNLKPKKTLKYFRFGCFSCDGYNSSCEEYLSSLSSSSIIPILKESDYK